MNILNRRTLFYLFIGLRLTLMLVYLPLLLDGVERGLTAFGDFQTYFTFAELSKNGQFPYRDYWYEFPPIFPAISLAVYTLTSGEKGNFTAYAVLLGVIMTIVDCGNLWRVMRIGQVLHGEPTALGLGFAYALLAAPLVLTWWTFEPLVTFFVLTALEALLHRRDTQAGVWIALGALTKIWPLALLGAVIRYRTPSVALKGIVITLILTGIGLGGMFVIGNRFAIPSLAAQFNKASYSTVWALLDRNYKTGNFGPVSDRFDPAKAYELQGNPATISAWLRLIVFAGIGSGVYITTRRYDQRGMVAFVTITIVLFFLWAQGWSPQWQTTLMPLILLNFPNRNGIVACLALSACSFIEYPVLFMRTGETEGVLTGSQLPLFAAVVIARTLLLAGVGVGVYQSLRLKRTAPAH
jgi:hypothetical protein